MNKKALWISGLLIILIAIVLLIWISNDKDLNETKMDNSFSDINGALIYSNWDAYIYSYTNESIQVQIPVYEFNHSLANGYSCLL